jgi:putative endopeptidase
MHRSTAFTLALASLAACGPSRSATEPHSTDVEVSLAEVGLEAESLDRGVDPCVDFYQFACGGWLARTEIPADRSRWGRFGEIDEQNQAVLHEILEDARRPGSDGDPVVVALGTFYDSCMDESAIERAGLTGVQPLLDLAATATDGPSLSRAIAALHRHGILAGFGIFIDADRADSTVNALYLDAAGLGLPDRDFYLTVDFEAMRDAYRQHLVRVFGLLGQPAADATASADGVMFIETELAKLTRTAVEQRDDNAMYNPMTLAELKGLAPSFDWPAYLEAVGNPGLARVVVTTPAFIAGLDALIGSARPAQWSAYLVAHIVAETAIALPRRFDDEQFALTSALSGVEQPRPRWQRCVDATAAALPEYLGQPFVARRFPGDSKSFAGKAFQAITAAMDTNLAGLAWMSDATKRAARRKLARLALMIGYPDTWKTYAFEIAPGRFAVNLLAANADEVTTHVARAGQPFDRREWQMPAFEVSAYYNPSANNAAVPAGILAPPFFGARRSIAANLGGIGMAVGHEMTHGFDDSGAQFDDQGRLADWWQPADLEHFQAQGQCLAKQFSTFEVLPGKFLDGELTLGENIADGGGVKLAFDAYRALRQGVTSAQVADGFTEDQQFFIAMGQIWCMKDRPEETIRRLTNDPHAPPRFRVNGTLRNFPAFAEAFQCAEGTPMHPTETCAVW